MNIPRVISVTILLLAVADGSVSAQQTVRLGENSALRYWSAIAQMQDASITSQDALEMRMIFDGTATYDDAKYKDLVEKNKSATETMIRGTKLPACDWGAEIEMGPDTPDEYIRKSLTLGRLNVLYGYHLLSIGDAAGAVRALAAGLRFSHDVGEDTTLFGTLVASSLIEAHLGAINLAVRALGAPLSPSLHAVLTRAVAQLGTDGLDWRGAMKLELEVTRTALNPQAAAGLARLTPAYLNAINSPSTLSVLLQTIASAPPQVQDILPSPRRVLEAKQELTDKLQQTRSLLQ
jgi:hypothetical protein